MKILLILTLLTACQTTKSDDPVVTPSKFGEKFKNLHRTIVISKPGTYDYEGTMHIWKGEGGCSVWGAEHPAMEIRSSNVTVKNFGVKDAKAGIIIKMDSQKVPENVTLQNLEVRSCLRPLGLPQESKNINIVDSLFLRD